MDDCDIPFVVSFVVVHRAEHSIGIAPDKLPVLRLSVRGKQEQVTLQVNRCLDGIAKSFVDTSGNDEIEYGQVGQDTLEQLWRVEDFGDRSCRLCATQVAVAGVDDDVCGYFNRGLQGAVMV